MSLRINAEAPDFTTNTNQGVIIFHEMDEQTFFLSLKTSHRYMRRN